MSSDRGVGKGWVIVAALRRTLPRLPSSKRFLADDEIPGQVFSPTRQCDQDVMIRPIGESGWHSKIGMSRGNVLPKKSPRVNIDQLNRKSVRDRPDGIQTDCCATSVVSSPADTVAPEPVIRNSGKRELSRLGHSVGATHIAWPGRDRSGATSGPASRTIRMSVAGETSSRSRRSAAWRTPRLSSAEKLGMKRL